MAFSEKIGQYTIDKVGLCFKNDAIDKDLFQQHGCNMGLRDNIYVELKAGDRVTLRNGDVLSYDEYYDKICNREDSRTNYTDTLRHKTRKELDVIEVKRPIEYTTLFTEEDIKEEDEELDVIDVIDAVYDKVEDALGNAELKKGNIINIVIQL